MGGRHDDRHAACDMLQHGVHHRLALRIGQHELLGKIRQNAETMRARIDHEIDAAALPLEVELTALIEDGRRDRKHPLIGPCSLRGG